MLVLSRKAGERIVIGDNIAVVVNRVAGNRVTLGIEAPQRVKIVRGELEAIVRQFGDSSDDASPACGIEFETDLADLPRAAR